MAKWGEGDPRWIVEEREDAINVNNWHWTEKNANQWSKAKLTELLTNLKISEPGLGWITITDVTSVDGEATANNRKAKLIFFYEWNIKADWKGVLEGQSKDVAVTGTIEIPNLSEENEVDEVDVNVSLKTGEGTVDGDALKDLMRNKGATEVRARLGEYVRQLKQDFAKDLILPTKDSQKQSNKSNVNQNDGSIKRTLNQPVLQESDSSNKTTTTCNLEIKEKMICRAEEFYQALTNPDMVTAFSKGPATIEPHVGGHFSLFDGNVSGTFTNLEPNKVLEMNWRFKAWPNGHFSRVKISLEEEHDHTLVVVKQTDIPAFDYERTENGWKVYYLQSMKTAFGFGSMLY